MQKKLFNITVAKGSVHNAAVQLYDAVLLYAYAVKEVVDAGDDPRDGKKVLEHMFKVIISKFKY